MKKRTTITVEEKVLEAAKEMGINISEVAETAIRAAITTRAETTEDIEEAIEVFEDLKVKKRARELMERYRDTMIIPERMVNVPMFTDEENTKLREIIRKHGYDII